jgi:hypothetical protein
MNTAHMTILILSSHVVTTDMLQIIHCTCQQATMVTHSNVCLVRASKVLLMRSVHAMLNNPTDQALSRYKKTAASQLHHTLLPQPGQQVLHLLDPSMMLWPNGPQAAQSMHVQWTSSAHVAWSRHSVCYCIAAPLWPTGATAGQPPLPASLTINQSHWKMPCNTCVQHPTTNISTYTPLSRACMPNLLSAPNPCPVKTQLSGCGP